MKTAEEIVIEHGLFCTCHEGYTSRDLIAPDCPMHNFDYEGALEEYASQLRQQPEPQPIEKLFDLKEDCYVWVKAMDRGIYPGRFLLWPDEDSILFVDEIGYFKQEAKSTFDSFIPAQIPNW